MRTFTVAGQGRRHGGIERYEQVIAAASSLHVRARSEEHTSELQSLTNLVCRLLLEKKKKKNTTIENK